MVNFASHSHSYNASDSIAPSYDFSADGRELQLRAVLYDTITASATLVFDKNKLHAGRTLAHFFGLLEFNDWLYRAHPTGLPWLQVFFRNLIFDESGSGHDAHPDFSSAQEEANFFDRAAGFCNLPGEEFQI